jgi:hypothetical protein
METPDPTYSCRLQPLQPEYVFTLTSEALVVERAGKTTRAPYRDIESVRLSFLPRGFYVTGFRTAIRAPGARTIKFDDASFSTGFLQERQSRAYRVFTLDLLERVRRANPRAALIGGRPLWIQVVTAMFGVALGVALAALTARSIGMGHWGSAAMFAAFGAAFCAWTWFYIARNRARDMRADGVPEDLLPPPA